MIRLSLVIIFIITTGMSCPQFMGGNPDGTPPNYNDGTWSMCKIQHGEVWGNVPYKTNGLPVGGGDGKEFEINCTPIPKAE